MIEQIKKYLDEQNSTISHFAKRNIDVCMENDALKSQVRFLRKAFEDQKLRMRDGKNNGYEAETVFWERCIWEIDEALKEGE